jgi:hypothetical protein
MLESIHTYPRRLRWTFELISLIAVVLSGLLCARTLFQLVWTRYQLDRSLFDNVPGLMTVVDTIGVASFSAVSIADLQRALLWLALALLLALVLRNALPTVRTSSQGMLVEFANGWLPIGWEQLRAVRVTQDAAGTRYVLMVEAKGPALTGWHRLYGLLYRFGLRRGFWVSSSITDFDALVKTMLGESARIARVLEGVEGVRLDERAASPLLGFMLSPSNFFGRRTASERAAEPAAASVTGAVIHGSYPARIRALTEGLALLLGALALLQYLLTMVRLAALQFPFVARLIQPYYTLYEAPGGAGWGRVWLLVAAHLLLLLGLVVVGALRSLLPSLETRPEGLALKRGSGWQVVPWRHITAVTDTELSDQNHVLFLTARGLPWPYLASGLLYGYGWRTGVLVTSALSNFEALMQRVVLSVTRAHEAHATQLAAPLLRDSERSQLLLGALRPGPAIDQLVAEAREEDPPPPVTTGRVLRAARPMVVLALLPALLLLADVWLRQAQWPSIGGLVSALAIFCFGLLEWPLVSLLTQVFDENTAQGSEGSRGLYLYPQVQLPRAVALVAALALLVTLGSLPVLGGLPLLLWLAGIGWSFLLAAGLWESLYDWRGTQLLIGGAVPALYQLMVLATYLLAR